MSVGHSKSVEQRQMPAPINGKKAYKAPSFVCYGSVSVLTQAAVTGNNEGGGLNNPNMAVMGSDIRFKENIARVGTHPFGFDLYLFDYKPEFKKVHVNGRQFGVMAQEVEVLMPDAVVTDPDGFKWVNYEMLGITLSARQVH